ncbi:hypothetical protein PHYSODRAFT_326159 [Phytophthora sojae]|uniref:Uncharacterized protein n=1 Tax=Phytophthora sojae (strain P6497) TaxID=1094619 RepID=G4YXU7_PHYSP|nr:hypothetical protein PHYSODRAFT_326159 [Phytophthora sojae]EGZ25090.1 hypothetical protein PHYSODRAFT_326159 [Phytophthora sojae]|eukprot:XP_009520378.1 hypothetical protein PHYSODRAFT_326159 [Phytophthora sojae]
MCRVTATIEPPGVLFGPSTATLEDHQHLPSPSKRTGVQFVPGAGGVRFKDEEFAREVRDRVAELVAAAAASDASSANTRLARRIVKYRNIQSVH